MAIIQLEHSFSFIALRFGTSSEVTVDYKTWNCPATAPALVVAWISDSQTAGGHDDQAFRGVLYVHIEDGRRWVKSVRDSERFIERPSGLKVGRT